MEKKKYLIAVAAILLVAGSIFTARAVREHKSDLMLFNANLEALLEPEAFQSGKGDSWKEYTFSINALFLHWDSCIYLYGVPDYPWMKYTCQ